MNFENIQAMLIDGDGVLYHGDEPVEGIVSFFKSLAERKIQWGLLTNNGTHTIGELRNKLNRFGVDANAGMIFSSTTITTAYLNKRLFPGARIYVIGEMGIKTALRDAGFEIFDGGELPSNIAAVVSSMDREFTYRKLRVATLLIRYQEALFIGTNPDTTFPSPVGIIPGAGSILAALAASTGQSPLVMGKPASTMFQIAMNALNSSIATTVMIGDRIDTDIAGAHAIGMRSILVLSGISTREEAEESATPPDLIQADIKELVDTLDQSSH
jgi:4-nitrophenyl phosphatase